TEVLQVSVLAASASCRPQKSQVFILSNLLARIAPDMAGAGYDHEGRTRLLVGTRDQGVLAEGR
ncbi:MAG TPA: hypothetical protein PL137_16105, partial [Nocardioides sp.]|nr:hypothetical protein [Nocardioides sp.]